MQVLLGIYAMKKYNKKCIAVENLAVRFELLENIQLISHSLNRKTMHERISFNINSINNLKKYESAKTLDHVGKFWAKYKFIWF